MVAKPEDNSELNQLRLTLIELFTLSELKDICFALNVDYERLSGEGKGSKARELVDYMRRKGLIQELRKVIQAERPNADIFLQTPSDQPCPYRGLFAFDEKNATNFFGRETYTKKLVTAVQSQSFVALVGPSGSGKSSVVFAGLIPWLRSENYWEITSFRPGNRPFYNLATALVNLDETLTSRTARLDETQRLAKALAREENPLPLDDLLLDLLQGKEEQTRLLLIADQFEELYTLVPDVGLRKCFLDTLLAINEKTSAVLLMTLRADFLAQALGYRPFADALQDNDIKLGPMTTDELRHAIRYPAQNVGISFESGLEDNIVRDLGDEPGNLPLLQFTLTQIWNRQKQRKLTHVAYKEIGRVDGALANYADHIYSNLEEEEQEQARRIFTRLVKPGLGTDDTRRLALRTDLNSDAWQLAQQLANDHLVVTGQDDDGRETVEVVHEALIRGWNQLRGWLEADRTFLSWLERLRLALEQWQISGQKEGGLLHGIPLDNARKWLTERNEDLTSEEQSFIEASIELYEREVSEQEAQQRRERTAKRFRRISLVVAPLLIGAILVTVLWINRDWLLLRCQPNCSSWGRLLFEVNVSNEDLNNINLRRANLNNVKSTFN